MSIKSTPAGKAKARVESILRNSKESAAQIKSAYGTKRKKIMNDPMTSDLAKREALATLRDATRKELDDLKAAQESSLRLLKQEVQAKVKGLQPDDANSIMLRRDAADRVRKITSPDDARDILTDAINTGDDTLAHAIGQKARNNAWMDVADTYQEAYADTSGAMAALDEVERMDSDMMINLHNQITFSDPV